MSYNDKKFINLGNNGLKVSRFGLGCMAMSQFYGATNDTESIKTLRKAYELGVNHFDTADMYGSGHNEMLLKQALKDFKRESIVIATKCGFESVDGNDYRINNTPEYIRQCCDDSLQRLGTDYIDLFYIHRVNPNHPLEITMQVLSDLVREGKILNIGLSEVSSDTIKAAHKIHPLAAIESEYSILHREPEEEIMPLCRSLEIGFVAYSPLSRGLLTGKINNINQLADNDYRRVFPRFQDENIKHNLSIVTTLNQIARRKNATTAQIALAWILYQGENVTAIPGARRIAHLEENLQALDLELSVDELNDLDNSIPLGFTRGAAYPQELARFSNT